MANFFRLIILLCLAFSLSSPIKGQDIKQYLEQYFTGSAFKFGYGSGTSSNNPRVELVIHYCSSGIYYSSGQSCRPNIIAKGYQCHSVQDMGRWQISVVNGQAVLQWASNTSGPGSVIIRARNDGLVVDLRGNPFYRVGQAQC